jgi:hypothetical protein
MRAKIPVPPLSPELRTILLEGPWAVGQLPKDLPPHDELRALWAQHGPALKATLPRGKKPWFPERDWFIRQIRGEPCP